MLFGLPARTLLRIDEKTALPRLNEYLHWLRILQFMVSVAFMGIFINFVVGLPHGFETTHRMTAVYALAIVAAVYPTLIWLLLWYFRPRSRALFLQVSRATDSFLASSLLIALAVTLGNAGLPSNCDELYIFNADVYRSFGSEIARANCNSTDLSNQCGTGTNQIKEIRHMCRTARAGFGLVILAVIVVYFMIAVANLYLYHKPRDSTPLPLHRFSRHRRAASGTAGSAQPAVPPAAHITNRPNSTADPAGEPPPPYTASPSNGESIQNVESVVPPPRDV